MTNCSSKSMSELQLAKKRNVRHDTLKRHKNVCGKWIA